MANQNDSGFGRREFIGAAAAALFAGVVIQITGCDSGTGSTGDAGSATGSISGNHPTPHTAVITKAQIDAGGSVTIDIQGAANHNHTLTLTAGDMANLKAKVHTMETSSDGGADPHNHVVMFFV